MSNQLPRDVFITTIFEAAKKDKNIMFLSADFGAASLDKFREELPNQFMHMGISEQNMIDVACGLALKGKKVFCYAMASFITGRCLEQTKVALGCMDMPVTLIGVGAGFGYDNAGPTHYATEDITMMRSIVGLNVYTPSDNNSVQELANSLLSSPELCYVRLDRKFLPDLPVKAESSGVTQIVNNSSDTAIVSFGYMIQNCLEVSNEFNFDVFDINVISNQAKAEIVNKLKNYKKIISVEEHFYQFGFGSFLLEAFNEANQLIPIQRIAIKDKYYFENGGREYLHQLSGVDPDGIKRSIQECL